MNKNVLLKIVFVIFILSAKSFSQVKKTPKLPNWIEKNTFEINPKIDESKISQGNLVLIYDEQVNLNTQEIYVHNAVKITDNVGIQSASNINITYDPTYQNLSIHSVKIIRDHKSIDKLYSSDFQTLRKESNSENYIYDGSLSSFTNLSDVRTNDIVEYSYTIKGFNPIHKNKYSSFFSIETSEPIGRVFFKFISKSPLNIKYFKTDLRFHNTQKGNDFVYILSQKNIQAHEYEDQTPIWYISSGMINVSNYKNWEDVVNWGIGVFKVANKIASDLKKKINTIDSENRTQGEKINAALKFVQNEIRYLGLESGIGAYKPFSPNKVFKQRYGDCKDKSLLLITMLNEMNIEAYPVLVNTYFKETIKDLLPGPQNFNHCVVKVIDDAKNELWFDPTITNQGGKFDKISFPDYRFGLTLKKGNSTLQEIYPVNQNTIETVNEISIDKKGKGASLKITTKYFDAEADYMRLLFKNNSISSIQKSYESYYAARFKSVKSQKLPTYEDSLDTNTFTTYENYRIDSLWSPSINEGEVMTDFIPYSITDMINLPNKAERITPYNLSYPASRKHKFLIEIPDDNWNLKEHNFYINSKNFFYEKNVFFNKKNKLLTIDHNYKAQANHVTQNEFPEFFANLTKLDREIGYSIIKFNHSLKKISYINSIKVMGSIIYLAIISLFTWLACKVHYYDMTPNTYSYFENNKVIGGWLLAVGLLLIISSLKITIELFTNNHFINGNWLVDLINNKSSFLFFIILFLEIIFSALTLVYYPLAMILFFNKRSTFPKIHSIYLFIFFVFYTLSTLSKGELNDTNISLILIVFIKTAIIIPYLLISDRSKETFVKTLKSETKELTFINKLKKSNKVE